MCDDAGQHPGAEPDYDVSHLRTWRTGQEQREKHNQVTKTSSRSIKQPKIYPHTLGSGFCGHDLIGQQRLLREADPAEQWPLRTSAAAAQRFGIHEPAEASVVVVYPQG